MDTELMPIGSQLSLDLVYQQSIHFKPSWRLLHTCKRITSSLIPLHPCWQQKPTQTHLCNMHVYKQTNFWTDTSIGNFIHDIKNCEKAKDYQISLRNLSKFGSSCCYGKRKLDNFEIWKTWKVLMGAMLFTT